MIRIGQAPEFKGEDVVLLAMDSAGVSTLLTALRDAEQRGSSQLEHDGATYLFVIQPGAADVELGDNRVVWRVDHAKTAEIVEHLTALSSNDQPGHSYVEISRPSNTLVLSRDEYIRVVPPS